MSNALHTSNESHRSPPCTQSIPSSPEQHDSITLAEVTSPPATPSFPLTIVTNYEQDSNSNHGPTASLIDLTQDSYPAVSPTLAETILALNPTLNATICTTAYGLATTVRKWTAQYTQKVTKAEQKIKQLEQINQQWAQDNQQLRAQLGLLSVPNSFKHNKGQVTTAVPIGGGRMMVLEWIRSVGNGQVELLAGWEPGEPTYVAELFLWPNYTENTIIKTAAPWFLTILTSRDGGFHTLIKEARWLNNLAAIAEIYCYQRLEDECSKLTCELNCVSDALTSVHDQLEGCRFHMEWAQLPLLLRHLEDQNSFTPSVTNLNWCCQNARRVCVNGGASP
jgi:hypothetical protein